MLQRVDIAARSLESYEPIVGGAALEALREAASPLRGLRIAHINATAYGGGVSELLHSLVPLDQALGIDCEWLVIPGTPHFFEVTKRMHNALQGESGSLSRRARQVYLEHSRALAGLLEPRYDVIWVHDPQPAALRQLCGARGARWIWRCHIDTSQPNEQVLRFLEPFLEDYDALVFTLPEFVPPLLGDHRVEIIAPAIDPLNPKNLRLPRELTDRIVQWAGVELDRPLVSQVSRFDPWKDPLGVIAVYRQLREHVPGVQLALLGQMALDDPEGWSMYRTILEQTNGDDDVHVLTNFTGIGNLEVNAFQARSDVVLQKSLREGFGLVVAETLWKGTPVVAGRAGGIPLQMPPGVGGYLVDSIDDCVERTLSLLRDPSKASALGQAGRAHIGKHFLITRLVADHLRLLRSLVEEPPARALEATLTPHTT
jgi:trehalose synthase